MASSESDRKEARGSWPIVRRTLAQDGDENLSGTTTAEERLAMMWPLARSAWALAGGVPDYPRSQAPVRISRRPLP